MGMDNDFSALLLGQPGPLRNSLLVVLRSIPVLTVLTVNEIKQPDWKTEMVPAVVLLDFTPPDDGSVAAIRWIKKRWQQTLLVILVQHDHQKRWALQAGADYVLFKGLPAHRLADDMEQLFTRQILAAEKKGEQHDTY